MSDGEVEDDEDLLEQPEVAVGEDVLFEDGDVECDGAETVGEGQTVLVEGREYPLFSGERVGGPLDP